LFQIGRGYVQQSDFANAVSYFERVVEQYPGQPAARDSLLQSAACYARLGKPDEAIKRYQRFIDLYPLDEKADRAYLNIIDVLRDQGCGRRGSEMVRGNGKCFLLEKFHRTSPSLMRPGYSSRDKSGSRPSINWKGFQRRTTSAERLFPAAQRRGGGLPARLLL
jgi:outer membrane protein assembly factor BamD (BamD/ComL family)